MLARGDSQAIQSLPAAAPPPFPAWARAVTAAETEAEAAFFAGAALSRLDAIVRENPPWSGVWRRRLALSVAAANVRRAGRTEGEAALRDALHLSRPGGDPGPAGKFLLASRELGQRPTRQWRSSLAAAAEVLGVPHDGALEEALEAAEACAASARPAPFAAARAFALARRALTSSAGRPSAGRGGEGELLAAWLADAVLAQRLNWPFALPLLAAPLFAGGGRRLGGDVADGAETAHVVFAYAKSAAGAVDLAGDLARRAEKLETVAPKLRAKGAGAALRALLDEDCLAASSEIGGQLSERGARRLFDRLVALGAIRELTGRATFRLYGL
ncbi:DUF1403 family protein [Rhodoblastus sp.]|uniref:DUF1403 family protein n=1 Tax=Rhodoblastus sp. TaxID=1962975 RepID=UPI003FD8BE43